jgi:hypothetical protein
MQRARSPVPPATSSTRSPRRTPLVCDRRERFHSRCMPNDIRSFIRSYFGATESNTLARYDDPTSFCFSRSAAPDSGTPWCATRCSTAPRSGRGHAIQIGAQAHLVDYYATHGFRAVGDEYDEDGIPHRHMRRAAGALD